MSRYKVGWYKEANLGLFKRLWRLFQIGWAIDHNHDPYLVDKQIFEKWGKK